MQNGFRDSQGEDVFIPIGLWQDPHHSFCYRVFNLYREIKVHKYQVARPALAFSSDADWTKLLAQAKKESDDTPAPDPDLGLLNSKGAVAFFGQNKCIYNSFD